MILMKHYSRSEPKKNPHSKKKKKKKHRTQNANANNSNPNTHSIELVRPWQQVKQWHLQRNSIKECHPTLFYHLKKQFYYLYHTILQYLPHPKTLFLLKYYSLIFLYYFFLTDIFLRLGVIPFSWAFQPYFFSSVSLNL